MEEFSSQGSYTPSRSRIGRTSSRKFKKVILIVLIFLVLVGLIFGGQQLIGGNKQEVKGEAISPTPTEVLFPTDPPQPTEEPSPTQTPKSTTAPTPTKKPQTSTIDSATKLDRSTLSIAIQNGSGQAGAASKASDVLKELGYKIVSLGNADSFDYQQTVIQVKSDKSNFLPLLKKDLNSTYAIGSTSASLSSTASGSADAIVIVGKE